MGAKDKDMVGNGVLERLEIVDLLIPGGLAGFLISDPILETGGVGTGSQPGG